MAVGLGLAVPHVRVASGTRAVSEGPGWLHVRALSCAGGLPVRAVRWEQQRALGPAAGWHMRGGGKECQSGSDRVGFWD